MTTREIDRSNIERERRQRNKKSDYRCRIKSGQLLLVKVAKIVHHLERLFAVEYIPIPIPVQICITITSELRKYCE